MERLQVDNIQIAFLMSGSCHIRSVLIGVKYQNWHRTLDLDPDLHFAILMGQIYKKLNYSEVPN